VSAQVPFDPVPTPAQEGEDRRVEAMGAYRGTLLGARTSGGFQTRRGGAAGVGWTDPVAPSHGGASVS
jgi:hypothetical protein